MKTSYLLHHLIFLSFKERAQNWALSNDVMSLSYENLAELVLKFSQGLLSNKIKSQERIAIFLEKRFEFVVSCFGSSCAGNIFIPINPILKKDQVHHILKDSGAKVFVSTYDRLIRIHEILDKNLFLELIVVIDFPSQNQEVIDDVKSLAKSLEEKKISFLPWETFICQHVDLKTISENAEFSSRDMIDVDAVSIFYTSGSTGRPKGVTLSHRNMVFGAKNVASYLENNEKDVILAALPLSFDAGFSQLTTAFHSSAKVVLLNYVLPNDILHRVQKEKVTGITAVPPLWIQLSQLNWPASVSDHLRYFANTGGKMPFEILKKLRTHFPKSKPYLMYGLTESFRSTYLPPHEIDRKVNSIGKAIPNAEILILKPDGSRCGPGELGELVHRGALVGLGYWNDPEKTAERYKPLPIAAKVRSQEIVLPEIAVFSGDLVQMDDEGFIYFIGRQDEMIKTSGYRVSPMEIEEVIYNSGWAQEVAVFSVPHPALEQGIISLIKFNSTNQESEEIIRERISNYCKEKLPLFMVPLKFILTTESLLRNQNGKIDRKYYASQYSYEN